MSEKALAFRERALPSTGADERVYAIEEMATDALEAGDLARAEQYANELLKDAQEDKSSWNYGNAIHKGNIVLGRVALRRGDIEERSSICSLPETFPDRRSLIRTGRI